ncbi:MAG: hypothetical protein IJU04_00115 [Ruminococcus sp.]|nr:hypothetical protein [Ruminococcus sp.]
MDKKYNKPSIDFFEFVVEDVINSSVSDTVSISVKTTAPITDIVVPDPWDDL